MEQRTLRNHLRAPAWLAAIVLGVLADALVRAEGRPGVNITLWALAGVGVLYWLVRRRGDAASSETRWLVGGALFFAIAIMLRDAEALAVFSLFAAMLLLGLAAGRAASEWATRAQVSEVVFAAIRHMVLCVAGPLAWGRGVAGREADQAGWKRQLRTVARGTLMALPALLVLGALLMSADPVFERIIRDTLLIDIEPVIEHVAFSALIAWVAAGYLRAFLVRDDAIMDKLRVPQPALAAAEVTVAVWILNLLFVSFMIVQLRYLFGGADVVQLTDGLSYADYARRGFFELVATTALVVPILLVADWAAQGKRLRASMLVTVVLLVGVIASAAYRMKLYQDAYGLTEQRLYVSVIIVWLTGVLLWLAFTVLRGHRDRFIFGSMVAGFACIAMLHVLNPHAVIARVNLDRAVAGAEVDTAYLRELSADAVPVLLDRLDQLPPAERCQVGAMLEKEWGGERPGGWRTWNLSDWRARRLVAPLKGRLACPTAVQAS